MDAPDGGQSQTPNRKPSARAALRALLVEARARLQPEDVGLPPNGRQRAPGLRREDVAELTGVSLNWYSAFEAGNGHHRFSPAFVQRVGAVLRLSDRERMTLFRLALSEVSEVVEHFDATQAIAGRTLATAIYRELLARESLLKAQAATGRALATAIYRQLVAQDALRKAQKSLDDAQASNGRALATEIYLHIVERNSQHQSRFSP